MTAVEMTGTVNEQHQLQLDDVLPIQGPRKVRVIVLYSPLDELSEEGWLKAAARNPAFESLRESNEDIYSPADGNRARSFPV
jgi:hypothetical protein